MASKNLLYEEFNRCYDRGVAAKDEGDIRSARRELLKAADALNKIAAMSDGEQKRAHLKRVRTLFDAVESLGESEKKLQNTDGETALKFSAPNVGLTFDDIVGLQEAKKAIRRMLINPLKNPEVYKRYKLEPGGYILLEGPPGTGKTTFAKAAAKELSVPFVVVDTNSLVDSYIGKTGKNIDKMFESAREVIRKNASPVVLFLDEFDAIAKKRGGENKTADEAVPTLIRQMDGFDTDNKGLIILASTNLKENIDSAVLSRFRNKIHIPLPTQEDRERLLELKLKGKISAADYNKLDLKRAASLTDGFSGRDLNWVCEEVKNLLAERDAGFAATADISSELFRQIEQKRIEKA